MKRVSGFLTVLGLLIVCGVPPAVGLNGGGRLETMKLLTTEVGWASSQTHLFWTTDAGRTWKDITPPEADPADSIASVFFLDTSRGWLLLSRYDEPQPFFDLASTKDGGKTWSLKGGVLPKLEWKGIDLDTHGDLFFADSLHGWMNVSVVSGSSVHAGAVLATEDGGKTWRWATGTTAGRLLFTSPRDGWVLGPEQDELEETHDGAKSWREPALHQRGGTTDREVYKYGFPAFADSQHGFLVVSFGDSVALFNTSDGGNAWHTEGPPPELGFGYTFLPSASGGPAYVTAAIHGNKLTLRTLPLRENGNLGPVAAVGADIRAVADVSGIDDLSFVDGSHGWALASTNTCTPPMTGCTQLLATPDGGVTWANVTPAKAKGVSATQPPAVSPKPRSYFSIGVVDGGAASKERFSEPPA